MSVELSNEERYILWRLGQGWILQKSVLRKASFVQMAQPAVIERLREKGLLAHVEVEGRQECCGLSEAGRAALGP